MRSATSSCALVVALLFGASVLSHAARHLRQETYTSIKGQTPGGFYAVADRAEAGAGGNTKGIRYNAGRTVISGDMIPGARSSATTGPDRGGVTIKSGNMLGEASANHGIEVMAGTYEGARAVAGSGVHHTAEEGAAVSANVQSFKPGTTRNKGSVAFTDTSHNSAAVNGMGNGPVAMAWGNEVGAMARSSRDKLQDTRFKSDRFQ